ncbi:uncharacterized protein LY79DRAFT_291951 [Colletotrichum navitas]|uniref:Uncharacterized protein n=1 Tax=Colletotrichum navitas TaxID=681940 RepID=A0AAD8PUG1_9PEZI|nr:uncharacterized protein LY79DRAFT_291951 [Colletotrichum navitas]KAK1584727.1 hypothetical protein LY79DRAFT_291951 [Colletotrichum navitas]
MLPLSFELYMSQEAVSFHRSAKVMDRCPSAAMLRTPFRASGGPEDSKTTGKKAGVQAGPEGTRASQTWHDTTRPRTRSNPRGAASIASYISSLCSVPMLKPPCARLVQQHDGSVALAGIMMCGLSTNPRLAAVQRIRSFQCQPVSPVNFWRMTAGKPIGDYGASIGRTTCVLFWLPGLTTTSSPIILRTGVYATLVTGCELRCKVVLRPLPSYRPSSKTTLRRQALRCCYWPQHTAHLPSDDMQRYAGLDRNRVGCIFESARRG